MKSGRRDADKIYTNSNLTINSSWEQNVMKKKLRACKTNMGLEGLGAGHRQLHVAEF